MVRGAAADGARGARGASRPTPTTARSRRARGRRAAGGRRRRGQPDAEPAARRRPAHARRRRARPRLGRRGHRSPRSRSRRSRTPTTTFVIDDLAALDVVDPVDRPRARGRPASGCGSRSTSSPSGPGSGRTSSRPSRSTTSPRAAATSTPAATCAPWPGCSASTSRRCWRPTTTRYADAPIDPRRVFEAELATGRHGPIRGVKGGPNWSVIVAAVMTVVLAWSVARLVHGQPGRGLAVLAEPGRRLGRADQRRPGTAARRCPSCSPRPAAAPTSWSATAPARSSFTGSLAFGQSRTLQVSPPVRIQSTDGSLEVTRRRPGPRRDRQDRRSPPRTCSRPSSPRLETVRGPSSSTSADGSRFAPPPRVGRIDRVSQPVRRPRDPGVRAQRGRLRGARRPAGRRRVPAGRRPGRPPTRCWSTPAASSSRPRRTRSTRCSRPPTSRATGHGPQSVVAVGCLAERYGAELADVAARGRRGARLRRLPRHRRPAAVDRGGGAAAPRTPRRTGAGCCRSRPSTGRRTAGRAGGAAVAADEPGPMAPLKLASGCDRRCTFCAIPSFRGSFVSRRPTDVLDEARWLAADGRPRAVPGQRELHVLRQGPRRPPAARDAAARARRRRRHRTGPGLLPPARRAPARAARGDRDHARRRAVLRPLLPARQQHGAAPDAPVRRPRELPRPARPGPVAGAGGRGPLQRDRRVPRRDRARPRDAVRLPGRRPARRGRGLRLLRRGRHRGRDVRRQARRGRGARPDRARDRPGRGAHRRSGPRSGSARRSSCWSRRPRDGDVVGRAAHQGPDVDGTTYLDRAGRGRRPGAGRGASRAEGVDLVATPL